MATGTPTDALDDRLDALARAVRRQRINGGVAVTVLIAILTALAAAFLDSTSDLSVAARCVLDVAWFALVGFAAWRFAVRPWQADPPTDEVAERMMADDSPNVVAALAREAKDHRAFPAWPSTVLASLAVVSVIGTLGLAAGSGERVRRLALPWHRPAVLAPFEIVVVSGDTVARRGEAITLTAYLKPRDANSVLPEAAVLKLGNREVVMAGANGAFHATLPAAEQDFEYRVEAGSVASEWFTVRIADAVELAAETTITIAPPEYASERRKPVAAGFGDLQALQHSIATFHLKFNRPAESASIEWRPDGRNPFEAPDTFLVALAADRRSGTASLLLRANGMIRTVLVNESGPRRLRTEAAIGVRVNPDRPPSFERIEGMATRPRTLRPGQQLPVTFTATDDHGIASASLEYATDATSGAAPLLLESTGATRVEGRGSFQVPVDAKEGETIRFRLRVRDSRRVPGENLLAQEAVFPTNGWFDVKVASAGPPFAEQQIVGQRDAVREVLAAAKEKIATWTSDAETLKRETAGLSPLPLDHALRFAAIREQIRETRTALERGAAETRLSQSLASLAGQMTALADGALREADEHLQQAAVDNDHSRARFLTGALKHLAAARAECDRMAAANDRLAQDRLDRGRLGSLEREQSELAASFNLNSDREVFAKRQRELLARLKHIVSESEPLNRAVAALAANETARLAGEVRTLTARIRALDAAANRLQADLRQSLLDERAAVQAELAKRVEDLAKKLDAPARLAALAKPKREDFDRVVELVRTNKVVEALTELERLAAGLDKLADECDSWGADRTDAKLAAGQFAKWQADVRTRYRADPKAPLLPEQAAILEAVEKLRVPAGSEAVSLRDAALVHLRLAKRRIETSAADADVAMKLAAEALERLAAKTPTMVERLTRGRDELEKLRKEHDAIITQTVLALVSFDKLQPTAAVMQNIAVKFGPIHTRQLKLADKLAALDLPNHEPRQARALLAVKAAAADLKDGLPFDAIASLGATRRELDRLKLVLEGQVPADIRAVELAAKQAEALSLVLAAGDAATVKQWERVIALQQEVAAGIGALAAPEAPALLHEAREATRLAEFSMRDGADHEHIVRRLRDAKETLALLADRITDREPERDRVCRWISLRRTAECGAKKLAGKPLNPEASAAAKDELKRELDEMILTRVGAAGQAAKKKTIESYLRLQNRPEPDRQAADQKQLADGLSDLAALLSGAAQLTARPDGEPLSDSDPAERYLPSRKHAAALGELARAERTLREQVNGVAAAVAEKLKPAMVNPFASLESRQRMLADSLEALARQSCGGSPWRAAFALQGAEASRRAAERLAVGDINSARECVRVLLRIGSKEFADIQTGILADLAVADASSHAVAAQHQARHAALAGQARELHQQFATTIADAAAADAALVEATDHLRTVERLLADASRKNAADAAPLRTESLRLIAPLAPTHVPNDAAIPDAAALAVKDAERAMLRAIRELGPKGEPKAAMEAMRRAADALQKATTAMPEG